MDDPWQKLHAIATDAIDPLWNHFAKNGSESAVFAPLAKFPNAAGWLATCMALSRNDIDRKLGAMLAGWLENPPDARLLMTMLESERTVFSSDPLSANSVAEDIMFAATRWASSSNEQQKQAGMEVLAAMIADALENTPWNTVNWATANLFQASAGKHEIFHTLRAIKPDQLKHQAVFGKVLTALIERDEQTLLRAGAAPTELCMLAPDDPHAPIIHALWEAVAVADVS